MDIRKLCELIDMPQEVIQEIEKWNVLQYSEALERYLSQVQDKANWNKALEEVKKILGDDRNGLKCLAFMMNAALRAYQEYSIKDIPEQIYLDTMGCFSRFVKEHKESFGMYGFDREWWTVRELTLREYRLGELEYEMIEKDGDRLVSVHIPSDAKLDEQKCRESYRFAKSFFTQYAGDYAEITYYCNSWLLSPKLIELLPENSRIIRFQRDFILDSSDPDNNDYKQWIFKNEALNIDEFPQNTSLQRRAKEYLKSGGKIGSGRGHIKKELFE